MARCACGTATCSCIVKAVPGSGIVVVGNGSPTRPYQIGQEGGGNPLLNLDVIDTPSLDLTISGAGTLTDKRIVTGVAHPSMRELRDVDASDVPANGDVVTWNNSLSKWVFSAPAAGSGVPPGGTTGQVLTKYSNLDGQANWQTPTSGGAAEQVYGVVRKTAANQSIPASVSTPVLWDIAESGSGIAYNADGTFVIPVTGWYHIDSAVEWNTSTSGYRLLSIQRNGVSVATSAQPGQAQGHSSQASITMLLTAGDLVRVNAFQTTAGALALTNSSNYNYVSIIKTPETIPASNGIIGERIYAAVRRTSVATSVASGATGQVIPFEIDERNDGIGWDATTNEFIVPVTGWYQMDGSLHWTANTTSYRTTKFYVNGTPVEYFQNNAAGASAAGTSSWGSFQRYLTAGDRVALWAAQGSGAALALAGGATYNYFGIRKVPSVFPQSVALGERNYSTSRRQSAAVSMASGAITLVPWDTEDFTDGIEFSAGVFTVPVAGYYQVNAKVGWDVNATGLRRIRILVNGSSGVPGYGGTVGASAVNTTSQISRVVKLAAGDTIQVQVDHTAGATLTTIASTAWNSIDIAKVPAPAVAGSAASGLWGVGPLAVYGSDSLQGRPVYVDSNGQLRAEPAGVWVDCKAEVRFCTDVSTTANAGQAINSARYMKIGKTVWFTGYGVVGTGAVVNFALLLPPSAGVPVTSYVQVGPPQAVVTPGDAVAGGWFLTGGDRIVNIIGSSGAYSDSIANTQYRWSIVYEVV